LKQQDVFEVGLRLFGIWSLLRAVEEACTSMNILVGSYTNNSVTANAFITHTCLWGICGAILLFKGKKISDFIYTVPNNQEKDSYQTKSGKTLEE